MKTALLVILLLGISYNVDAAVCPMTGTGGAAISSVGIHADTPQGVFTGNLVLDCDDAGNITGLRSNATRMSDNERLPGANVTAAAYGAATEGAPIPLVQNERGTVFVSLRPIGVFSPATGGVAEIGLRGHAPVRVRLEKVGEQWRIVNLASGQPFSRIDMDIVVSIGLGTATRVSNFQPIALQTGEVASTILQAAPAVITDGEYTPKALGPSFERDEGRSPAYVGAITTAI